MLGPNWQTGFRDGRDVRERIKCTACKSKCGGPNISIAAIDEHMQTVGAESFAEFERSVQHPADYIRSLAMLVTVERV